MNLEDFKKRIEQKENTLNVNIDDKISGERLIYNIKNLTTLGRAQTLFTKEPITITWLRSFEKNKIFFDVGANVGMYSIFSIKFLK